MKIKNEKEIFDLYVEKDNDLREVLKKPFIQETDGRVWASEGHILIMVNQECVSGKYEIGSLGNKLPVREYNTDIPLRVSDLQDAINRCPQEPEVKITYKVVECPECEGTGTVEAEYRADYDDDDYMISGTCPICDGEGTIEEEIENPTGRMVPKKDSIIKLGKGYFNWHHFETITKTCKMLDIENIRLVRTHKDNMSIIELSKDIHVGFMPMYLSDEEGEKLKKGAIKVKGIKV